MIASSNHAEPLFVSVAWLNITVFVDLVRSSMLSLDLLRLDCYFAYKVVSAILIEVLVCPPAYDVKYETIQLWRF